MTDRLDRRLFLHRIGAATSIGAFAVVAGRAGAQPAGEVPDSDTAGEDETNRAITDDDVGTTADPRGTGCCGASGPETGITDSDTGSLADPANHGRGQSGLTDSDSEPEAHPESND